MERKNTVFFKNKYHHENRPVGGKKIKHNQCDNTLANCDVHFRGCLGLETRKRIP